MTKKILITGGTGFIGSHLCEFFLKRDYLVTVFDRYNHNYDLGNLQNSEFIKKFKFIFGDLRDFDSVYKSTKNIDAVFHLGAIGGIPYSYFSPQAYIRTNIDGTYNILEACRLNKVKQIILTSTSEVYGTAQKIPINEIHPLVAQSPYAASKIAADQLAISYYKSYNLSLKIARPFNVFGPRQSLRAIIPTIINQALHSKKYIKLGNIYTSRDYTYVDDVCDAFLQIYKLKNSFGIPFNIGTGIDYKIYEIAEKIIKIINPNLKIKIQKERFRPKKSEVLRLVCDNQFFRKKTSWKPKVNFEIGLKKTIEWFRKNPSKHFNDYNI